MYIYIASLMGRYYKSFCTKKKKLKPDCNQTVIQAQASSSEDHIPPGAVR